MRENGGGDVALKVSVTAVPEDGKANRAVIRLLSKVWAVPKSDMVVVAGATDRNKVLLISGGDASLLGRLEKWLEREMA